MSASETGSDWRTYRRLLSYVKGQWAIFALAVAGFLIGAGAEAFFVNVLGQVVDALGSPQPIFWFFPALILGAAVVRALGAITGELLLSRISFSVVHKIRCELFDRLMVLPSAFYEQSAQGHLVSRLTFTTAQLRDATTDAIKIIVQDGGKLIVFLAAMFILNWKLTALFLAVAPIVALVVRFASKRFRKISQRIQNSMGDVTHVASEAVSGYREVRTFGGETFEKGRFGKASNRNRAQNLKMVATKASSAQLIQVFVAVAIATLVGLILQPDLVGVMSEGRLIEYIGLAGMLASPIKKLSDVNARLQRGLAAAHDVFEQIDHRAEVDDGVETLERAAGGLEFRNVSFKYDTAKEVLNDVSLKIDSGQTVALVGPSGAGKTTLASLIPRFYEAADGQVLLDGKPIDTYTMRSLRDQIAIVSQDVVLFNDTLRANVAYGALANRSDEEISNAIERAHATEFVANLSDGLDTMLGDNGTLLSGGQRQRVAIARALLKDAPILILDEATSSLDTESERHIQAALAEVMRGRTTLVIAHRLTTIEKADVIVVLEDGAIVEQGAHDDLIARDGKYAALYRSQFLNGDEQGPPATQELAQPRGVRFSAVPTPAQGLITNAWYGDSIWIRALAPLAWVFRRVVQRRRMRFLTGRSQPWRAPVPVVVVGNITVGGTGKSPLVIWLARWLVERGVSVGIVSRGYGGKAKYPLDVSPASSPQQAGDEAPMLALRTGCPVVVDPDRVRAAKHMVESVGPDVIVSDDGMQHYALARDIEIAVMDGRRSVGNGRMLPAGPLREPVSRLGEVDWVVVNGERTGLAPTESRMDAVATAFVNVKTSERLGLDEFSARVGRSVVAMAGIGNPARFERTLVELGFEPVLTTFADHHEFKIDDLRSAGPGTIVVTEKDAVKVRRIPEGSDRDVWYLEIDIEFDAPVDELLEGLFREHGIDLTGRS